MHRKIFMFCGIALAAVGIAYSARQLADPVPVKAIEPVCCISDKGCGGGQTCGKANCDGLNGGACN